MSRSHARKHSTFSSRSLLLLSSSPFKPIFSFFCGPASSSSSSSAVVCTSPSSATRAAPWVRREGRGRRCAQGRLRPMGEERLRVGCVRADDVAEAAAAAAAAARVPTIVYKKRTPTHTHSSAICVSLSRLPDDGSFTKTLARHTSRWSSTHSHHTADVRRGGSGDRRASVLLLCVCERKNDW